MVIYLKLDRIYAHILFQYSVENILYISPHCLYVAEFLCLFIYISKDTWILSALVAIVTHAIVKRGCSSPFDMLILFLWAIYPIMGLLYLSIIPKKQGMNAQYYFLLFCFEKSFMLTHLRWPWTCFEILLLIPWEFHTAYLSHSPLARLHNSSQSHPCLALHPSLSALSLVFFFFFNPPNPVCDAHTLLSMELHRPSRQQTLCPRSHQLSMAPQLGLEAQQPLPSPRWELTVLILCSYCAFMSTAVLLCPEDTVLFGSSLLVIPKLCPSSVLDPEPGDRDVMETSHCGWALCWHSDRLWVSGLTTAHWTKKCL